VRCSDARDRSSRLPKSSAYGIALFQPRRLPPTQRIMRERSLLPAARLKTWRDDVGSGSAREWPGGVEAAQSRVRRRAVSTGSTSECAARAAEGSFDERMLTMLGDAAMPHAGWPLPLRSYDGLVRDGHFSSAGEHPPVSGELRPPVTNTHGMRTRHKLHCHTTGATVWKNEGQDNAYSAPSRQHCSTSPVGKARRALRLLDQWPRDIWNQSATMDALFDWQPSLNSP
jgi:hypothetical protein